MITRGSSRTSRRARRSSSTTHSGSRATPTPVSAPPSKCCPRQRRAQTWSCTGIGPQPAGFRFLHGVQESISSAPSTGAGAAGEAWDLFLPTIKRRENMSRFAGKVVLFTGGNVGIGRAAAEAFAREGAVVVISARREAEGIAAVERIQAAGGAASFVRADVSREEEVPALVAQTVNAHGRLDVVFNNAGIEGKLGPVGSLSSSPRRLRTQSSRLPLRKRSRNDSPCHPQRYSRPRILGCLDRTVSSPRSGLAVARRP